MDVEQKVWGIDFGSKLAGTTVVAYAVGGQLHFKTSAKKQDADEMIRQLAWEHRPALIGIDAPLSLPGVYTAKPGFDDHFYRLCDKETKAMSPMFLGGLTARAMKLAGILQAHGTELIEVYPVYTGTELGLKAYGYRSKTPDLGKITDALTAHSGLSLGADSYKLTGHHIDAWLALITTRNYQQGKAQQAGAAAEGLIYY